MKQTEFADKLHITRTYLSQIEKGREPSQALQDLFVHLQREWADKSSHSEQLAESNNEIIPDSNFGARSALKRAREAKGMSQHELARAVGYPLGTYQEIEDGRSGMGEKMAKKTASLLGIHADELLTGSDHPASRNVPHGTFGAVPDIVMPPGQRAKYVPLLSMAQCGTMHAYDDGAYTHDGFLAMNTTDPKAFAVTLSGDSMTPRFEPGDVAVVYPSKPARNGCVVIAKLNDENGGDVMLKLFQAAGDKVILSSYNQVYQPLEFPRAAFQWIYPVASVTKVLA